MTDETALTGVSTGDGVNAAAELGRRLAQAGVPDEYGLTPDTHLIARTLRNDEHIEIHNLECHLDEPLRNRGTVIVHEPADFAYYVTRLASANTTVWADEDAADFTAVFNDHADWGSPGWRDHTAVLRLQMDPDWQAWRRRDGKLGGQAEFAEHIEDFAHTVISPDAATMREVAQTFQAHRLAQFNQGTRLASGDVQLRYEEDTSAKAGVKGDLEVPEIFTLALSPFVGVDAVPVEMIARLRYRIREGHLAIGYKLHRPDIVVREAFAATKFAVEQRLAKNDSMPTTPVYLGSPPSPVHPQ